MLDLSAVIVSYNQKDLVTRCISSLTRETIAPSEIIVVDNGSADKTCKMLAREFPAVRVICNTTNTGFGAAANQGIAAGRSTYVVLLNSDTEPTPQAVPVMMQFMYEHPKVAALGPKLLNSDGTLQPSCYSSMGLSKSIAIASGLHDIVPFRFLERLKPYGLIRRFFDFSNHEQIQFPDWFRGAVVMFRRKALEQTGAFDDDFFVYCEEIDLFYRLRRLGWQVAYTPDAAFIHHGQGNLPLSNQRMARIFWESFFRFYGKYHRPGRLAGLRLLMFTGLCIMVARTLVELALDLPHAAGNFRGVGFLLLWQLRYYLDALWNRRG